MTAPNGLDKPCAGHGKGAREDAALLEKSTMKLNMYEFGLIEIAPLISNLAI